jgi:hypothetical protein
MQELAHDLFLTENLKYIQTFWGLVKAETLRRHIHCDGLKPTDKRRIAIEISEGGKKKTLLTEVKEYVHRNIF